MSNESKPTKPKPEREMTDDEIRDYTRSLYAKMGKAARMVDIEIGVDIGKHVKEMGMDKGILAIFMQGLDVSHISDLLNQAGLTLAEMYSIKYNLLMAAYHYSQYRIYEHRRLHGEPPELQHKAPMTPSTPTGTRCPIKYPDTLN